MVHCMEQIYITMAHVIIMTRVIMLWVVVVYFVIMFWYIANGGKTEKVIVIVNVITQAGIESVLYKFR